MSDTMQEWPAHGGSFTRQPDGALVRNEEKPAQEKKTTEAAPAGKPKRGQ